MADAKPAVERLSEDESLRGDLSDIGFGPLLDWAVAAVEAYAPQAATSDALDAYTARVKGVVQAAVQAAQDSKLEDPQTLLDFDPSDRGKTLAAIKAVTFGDDPDENGSQLAAALQTGLSKPGAAESAPATPEPAQAENPGGVTGQTPSEASPAPESSPPQPSQAAAPPAPETSAPSETTTPGPEAAEPVKKNEPGERNASPVNASPNPNPNSEPPANPAPTNPGPGGFIGDLRSKMGQAYNSAWGLFKGITRRKSG